MNPAPPLRRGLTGADGLAIAVSVIALSTGVVEAAWWTVAATGLASLGWANARRLALARPSPGLAQDVPAADSELVRHLSASVGAVSATVDDDDQTHPEAGVETETQADESSSCVATNLEQAGESSPTSSELAPEPSTMATDAAQAVEVARVFSEFLEFLSDDLTQTRSLLGDAVGTLDAGFRELGEMSAAQQKTAVRCLENLTLTDSDKGDADSFAAQTDQILQDFVDLIIDVSRQSMLMVRRFMAVSELMEEVDGVLGESKRIADQSRLLAINAAIEAAGAGVLGKSFAVVAQEVKVLSAESRGFTQNIEEVLSTIRSEVGGLCELAQNAASRDMTSTMESKERVAAMMERMSDINSTVNRDVDLLSAQSEGISKSVAEVVRGLQFEDIVGQLVDRQVRFVESAKDLCEQIKSEPSSVGVAEIERFREQIEGPGRAVTQEDMDAGDVELF